MRTLVIVLITLALACLLIAQAPITVGGDHTAGRFGIVKSLDWYNATASGCTAGTGGACVGTVLQGDQYNFTAWMPSAAGLPKTSGLPIVGSMDDFSFGAFCSGNLSLIQLDVFSWATPNASHIQSINCMSSYGTSGGAGDRPVGWWGALTSGDGITLGTWKNWAPISVGGILYLPVERQYSPGDPSVHDGTFVMSPDSGAHWCNVYTYWQHSGSPGCDSSNWDANGDAPHCDAASSSSDPCLAASYTDATHSSIMWKGLPSGTDNWNFVNYMYQDCTSRPCTGQPTNVVDGCDPATYLCFIQTDGTLGRVNLVGTITGQPDGTDIMDISKWQYYTCPGLTLSYRCPSADPANWTSTFASRTTGLFFGSYYLGPFFAEFPVKFGVQYIKEFGSYLMTGSTHAFNPDVTVDFMSAPRIEGPWTIVVKTPSNNDMSPPSFFRASPALGYDVISSNPPRVQLTISANNYDGGAGSPVIAVWDLVMGRTESGEQLRCEDLQTYVSGACYKFSRSYQPGATIPSNGLVWAFDYLDAGAGNTYANWPFFMDRGNYAAVMVPCDGAWASTTNNGYNNPLSCGSMNSSHGVTMNGTGVKITDQSQDTNSGPHFRSFVNNPGAQVNAPSAMAGNGSFSIVGVYKYNSATPFGRPGGMVTTGVQTTGDNTMFSMDLVAGNLQLNWNSAFQPHYQYLSSWTFPDTTNYYFLAVTVQAQGGGCTTACVPTAHAWAGVSGALTDYLDGVSYTNTPSHNASVQTPNVSAGPLVMGMNGNGDCASMDYNTLMVYDHALTQLEVEQIYKTLKTNKLGRGVTVQ